MGTLGRTTRNGKKPAARRIEKDERSHRAIAKLAVALKEHKEAVEQQAATAEILRVISISRGDLRPVFDAILKSALKLCDAHLGVAGLIEDGLFTTIAQRGAKPQYAKFIAGRGRFKPKNVLGRMIATGQPVQVADLRETSGFRARNLNTLKIVHLGGARTYLAMPLVSKRQVIGGIAIYRPEVRPFTRKQVALVKTFADQAVIAIENARLLSDIQDRNAELKRALDFQGASGEILSSISQSISDTKPVFDAIAENTRRLLGTNFVAVSLLREDRLELAAAAGEDAYLAQVRTAYPWRLEGNDGALASRALRGGQVVHLCPIHTAPDAPAKVKRLAKASGYDSILMVPMLREGAAIGLIATARTQAIPFDDKQVALIKAFADQAVIALENARLLSDIQDRNAELKQALDFQGASGDILTSISSSVTDTKPVFNAIVKNVLQLFGTRYAAIFLIRDDKLELAEVDLEQRLPEASRRFRETFPQPIDYATFTGKALLSGQVSQLVPIIGNPNATPQAVALARTFGYNCLVVAPLVRDGQVVGAIGTAHPEAKRFGDKELLLLKAFADQAVIAIENARLFNETKEALERQTATSEVLEVISSSATDTQPVFDAIVRSGLKLFPNAAVAVVLPDGQQVRSAAVANLDPVAAEALRARFPFPLTREYMHGIALLERKVVDIPDAAANSDQSLAPGIKNFLGSGYRAITIMPMLRGDAAIGAISVVRLAPGPLTDKQIALLKTFADQAVIAIENARLFNETKDALDRQTATGEILASISSSITETQPVFDAIVRNLLRLLGTRFAVVQLVRNGQIELVAVQGDPGFERIAEGYPVPLDDNTLSGRAIITGQVQQVSPITGNPAAPPTTVKHARSFGGYEAAIGAPMIRDGKVIGALSTARRDAIAFDEKQVALIRSFADQAVIAIENSRLFNETRESLEQQTAISEILRVISSSPADVKPVLDAVAERAMRICESSDARIFLVDGDKLRYTAGLGDVNIGEIGMTRPLDRGLVMGRAVIDRAPMHIEDVTAVAAEFPIGMLAHRQFGHRTILAVPLTRDGRALGAILLRRMQVRPFTEKQISLLRTFADQAAIAIENVRLFNETKEALERQTATSEILRAISGAQTDAGPVFDAIARNAVRLCDAVFCNVLRYDGETLHVGASHGFEPEFLATLHSMYPMRPAPSQLSGRVILQKAEVRIADAQTDERYDRAYAAAGGFRRMMAVPMMRDGNPLGVIVVAWRDAGETPDSQVDLLKTFADQAVIAIENVRLFNETKEALEQQTATGDILKVISSSPTDTQPVFDAIVQSAARLFDSCRIALTMREGDLLQRKAGAGPDRSQDLEELGKIYPLTLDSERSASAQALAEGRIVEFPDTEAPEVSEIVRRIGRAARHRSVTVVPLIREGVGIGSIAVTHPKAGFKLTGKQLALLRTFADQAVIAIENARLFNELQSRNRELTETLEQQTATGEILRVISRSTMDVQPVFDTIVRNSVRLCDSEFGALFTFDGKMMGVGALLHPDPKFRQAFREAFPQPIGRHTPSAHAILERRVVNVPDLLSEVDYSEDVKERARRAGYRSVLTVPMMRGDTPIGAIAVTRREVTLFADSYVALLHTFADQAVIAVENVRLFNEINEALRQQTSTAEVLKTISRSTFDLQTVLQALVDNAARLSGATRAVMYRPDAEDNYRPVVTCNYEPDSPLLARLREHPIRPGRDSINGRVLLERKPIHVADVLADPEYGRQDLVDIGRFRTVLSVPMLRDGEAIGLISLTKGAEVDPFTEKQMELVTTFADQAVIAIENVRLFEEIEEKSAQLEVANKHKSEFLANMSHELRTPLNAIIGFSEVLSERMFGEINEKQADYLKDIHESGKHLLSLINDILDLSKIEAGRMELELSRFHLPTAISNALTLVRERALRHGIALGQAIDSRLGELEADERKVKQILLNLLSNAVKFTPDGGRVDVNATMDTDKVEIAVKDTGIGIALEDQTSLFEEFRQVGKDSRRNAEGTGLGLALTRKLVVLHGGEIRLDSAPGKGSTFTVTLPIRL